MWVRIQQKYLSLLCALVLYVFLPGFLSAEQPLQNPEQPEKSPPQLPQLTVSWNSFDWLLSEIERESEKLSAESMNLSKLLLKSQKEAGELQFSLDVSVMLRQDLENSLKAEREAREAEAYRMQEEIHRQAREILRLKITAGVLGGAAVILCVGGIIGWVLYLVQ